ncbi:hypothetical protein A8C56_00800 [Niabella ginsenosidivorans]|uniref:Integrase n=1 Tax=Niabella ginsenosidivorans TaxID=1176587 RepID=A0A1A9HWE6_9BACT|nr:DUF664 domain-containing protein [Niabella ginsenosidivorans]ANH79706.1 hypothetical protein A8C56_00800 [Niabella ginsenosidivorans]
MQTQRRTFIKSSMALFASTLLTPIAGTATFEGSATDEGLFMIGPIKGYTPQIGTLVSMLNYNRSTVVKSVEKLSRNQIDFLLDDHANTIAALVMHLGAVDKFYQINTFEGREEFNDEEKKLWQAPLELGAKGRAEIRGHDIQYYLDLITEVRNETLEAFKKKDDKWLLAVDRKWSPPNQPLNTYWKWFHVCEHESNHRGQIAFLKSRLPGAKPAGTE